MAKLTLHLQGVPGWVSTFLARSGAKYIKGVNVFPNIPGVRTIGRVWVAEAEADAWIAMGKAGAIHFFNRCLPVFQANPHVWAWEGPNEPAIWTAPVRDGFAAFYQELTRLMHDAGLRLMVGQINTGWPIEPEKDSGKQIRAIGNAIKGADAWSLHEYSYPNMWDHLDDDGTGWLTLRYRKVLQWLQDAGYTEVPPLFITECGIDQQHPNGVNYGHFGWRTLLKGNEDAYLEQLLWYERELRKDPIVQAATIFTVGAGDWGDFEVPESLAMKLADRLANMPDPPTGERAKGFYVSQYQGTVNWDLLQREGYSFVHVRATSGHKPDFSLALHKDPTFEDNWEQAGRCGFLRSVWHYFVQDLDGQAGFFRDVVGSRQPELGYYLDLEDNDITAERPTRFLEHADRYFGQPVGIYTSAGWMNARGTPSWTQGRKLWVANWTTRPEPYLPKAWKDWEFWQYICTSGVPGFPKRVCLDRFNGTAEELRARYPKGKDRPAVVEIRGLLQDAVAKLDSVVLPGDRPKPQDHVPPWVPGKVSGRPVTNRGVHLLPFGFHDAWMADKDYWIKLLVDMGMSWVVALSESDALRISGAAEALLEAGVIPIVRFAYQFPGVWTHEREVGKLAEIYARYGAPLIVQFANEPFDSREWKNDKVPGEDEAWAIIRDRWNDAARKIVAHGGYAGFPDGPCYGRNPFEVIGDPDHLWADGKAVYLGHHYGKGRPVDYPYDPVSQEGVPLTWEEYLELLDDYRDHPDWNEGPAVLEQMNSQRKAWAKKGLTPIDDDTCFLGWEKVLHWSKETFGFPVYMAMTEGGWVPRDRAGSGPVDIRWPMTTPRMVARKTVEMYEYGSPLFAICPWLLADRSMGGGDGWAFDAWVGWAYSDRYGLEKPVVQALKGR